MRSPKLDPGDMSGLILVAVIAIICAGVFAVIVSLLDMKAATTFFAGVFLIGLYVIRMRR